jgi:hypothetical protein
MEFAQHFLGVVEKDIPATRVNTWNLMYTARDEWLIEESSAQRESNQCFMAQIFRLMELADSGICHVDGQSNFSYMRSPVDRKLWAVHWSVNALNEWTVGAVFVPHPQLDWRSGSRLFNRQSLLHSSSCIGALNCGQ